jgi:hypothetical protein
MNRMGRIALVLGGAAIWMCGECAALETNAVDAPQPASKKKAPPAKSKPAKKGVEPQQAQQSFIIFYWPKGWLELPVIFDAIKERMTISIDGKPMGRFSVGEYIKTPVEPGSHYYSYDTTSSFGIGRALFGEAKIPVEVRPGESVYFEIVKKIEPGPAVIFFPNQARAEAAQRDLPALKPSAEAR